MTEVPKMCVMTLKWIAIKFVLSPNEFLCVMYGKIKKKLSLA